ncbi:MAG TPA: dienelactone hydrolase family protein [Thermomicrobiaceae bacterium]|nr:dienelactone hydrolase family protein [Thermomicrobiaceae bacterium]
MNGTSGWALRGAAILVLLALSVFAQTAGVAQRTPLARQGRARAASAPSTRPLPRREGEFMPEQRPQPGDGNLESAPRPGAIAARYPRIDCQPAPLSVYHSCVYHDARGLAMTFYLYFPRHYDARSRYPLVLLLHGGGQRADPAQSAEANRDVLLDDPYVQVWGPGFHGPHSVEVQARWPSFVVAPQLVYPNRWVDAPPGDGSHPMAPEPTDSLRLAKEIVDTLRASYPAIDGERLYITGMSLGGYGTWDAIQRWPHEFAAAAPICGAGDPARAGALTQLPIWAFHGADDQIVPVSGTRQMIEAIRAAGGHPRYTELTGVGHSSWLYAYALAGTPPPTPDFFPWLFAQHRLPPSE